MRLILSSVTKHLTKLIWTLIIFLLYYPSQYAKRAMYQNQ